MSAGLAKRFRVVEVNVGVLVSAMKDLKEENKGAHNKITELLEKQNNRIRKLENWRSAMVACIALLSFLSVAGLRIWSQM